MRRRYNPKELLLWYAVLILREWKPTPVEIFKYKKKLLSKYCTGVRYQRGVGS
jgi:hypothetical protein